MTSGRSVTVRIRVRFGETDAAGIVYYGTYFMWFDVGAQQLVRVPGVPGVAADGKPRYPLPLVECGATFFAPVRYDQELDVVSRVVAIGDTSLRLEHEVRTLDGNVVARGFQQRVFVRFLDGRLEKETIPQELRAHLTDGA